MSVVGIDFGNSNSIIAVAQKGGVDVITNEVSNRQTPTMVAFGDKQREIGEPALTQYARNIKNTITNIKRFIGLKYKSELVQNEAKKVPFKVREIENGEVGIDVMFKGELQTFTPVALTAMILQKLRQTSEAALEGRAVKDVVLGVPGWWTDQQRNAFFDAAKIAGLNPLRLMNEITAIALQYGIYKTNLSDTEPIHVMFVDVGTTTTSVGVVEFLKGKLKVLSTAYDYNLGGRDFDDILVKHFAKEFKDKYKIDVTTNQRALIRVETACERLKKILNSVPQGQLSIDSLMNDIDVKGNMERAAYQEMCKPLCARLLVPIKRALEESKIPQEKLFAVEITGGSTRLTPVQNYLTEFFKRELSKTMNFEEAVARGCALQCAMLSPVFKVRDFAVNDISLYPIRISWRAAGTDAMIVESDTMELFGRNSSIPCPKMATLYSTQALEVFAEYVNTPEAPLPAGSELTLAKMVLPNVPQKEKDGKPATIKLKVKLDLHGIFRSESVQVLEPVEEEVPASPPASPEAPKEGEKKEEAPKEGEKKEEGKAEEKKKKVKAVSIPLELTTSALSEKVINQMIEFEMQLAAADKLAFETADRKNAVESYIYNMRSKINESLSPFATEDTKTKFSKMLEDAESWLYGEGEDVTKSIYVQKLDELKAVGDPIERRFWENENRYDSIIGLRSAIDQFRMAATSQDPKYDHIEAEEKKKVLEMCDSTEKWLNGELSKQDSLPKTVDPILTVSALLGKKAGLEKFATSILNKPKPPPPKVETPKPEEKKPEEKKPEEKKPEEKMETEKPAEEKEKMDLD